MEPADIALVILAAGQSMRFGAANKLLSTFRGKALASHIVDHALGLSWQSQIAVLEPGSGAAPLFQGFKIITNPKTEAGQGGSIALGAEAALETGADAALFLLADMPFITASYLSDMIEASGGQAVASQFEGRLQPPMLFPRAELKRLTGLPETARGRDILPQNVLTFPLPPALARDIDTQEDLARYS